MLRILACLLLVAGAPSAFDRVRALPLGEGPEVEARLAEVIGAAGLTVEQYNALVERLERSERFRARVATALGFIAQR